MRHSQQPSKIPIQDVSESHQQPIFLAAGGGVLGLGRVSTIVHLLCHSHPRVSVINVASFGRASSKSGAAVDLEAITDT